MKLVRHEATHGESYPLYVYFIENTPKSLEILRKSDAYCTWLEIVRGPVGSDEGIFRRLRRRMNKVARVTANRVELYAPEFYADFETLVRGAEAKTGYDLTLEYWEAK